VLAEEGDHYAARLRLEAARELYESLRAAQPEKAALRKGLDDTLRKLAKLDLRAE
jgi:hypothetical protein